MLQPLWARHHCAPGSQAEPLESRNVVALPVGAEEAHGAPDSALRQVCHRVPAVSRCFQDIGWTLVRMDGQGAKAVKSFRQFWTKCIQATVYLEDAFSSLSSGMLSKATFCVTQRPEAWQKQVTMILPHFTNVRQQHLKARLVISVAAGSCSSFYHTAAGVWFACKFRKANDQPRLFPRNTRHRMHATAPSIRRLDPVCVHDVPF